MRIKFDKLRIQNFYSYGDMQEIDFNKFNATVILIDGIDKDTEGSKIGSGKSSLIAAMTYSLFGETISNVKANEIVNYIKGKKALVELEFYVEKVKYKVERGRKPVILNIYRQIEDITHPDGVTWDNISKTDNRDSDKLLKSLVRMDFETFLQTTFFSVASEHNKPFLNLTVTNQKRVLEGIFSFDIYNEKIAIAKLRIKDENLKLVDLEASMKEINYANTQIHQQLERLESSYDSFENRRIKESELLTTKIEYYSNIDIKEEKEKYDFVGELNEHKVKINEVIRELKTSQKDIKISIDKELREIEIIAEKYGEEQIKNTALHGNLCPTCNQDWEDETEIATSDKLILTYEHELLGYDASITEYEKALSQINHSLSEKTELIVDIREALDDVELSVDRKELDNVDIVVGNLKKELEQIVDQPNHYRAEIEANKALIRNVDMETIDTLVEGINYYKSYVKIADEPKKRGAYLRRYIKQSNEILRGFKKLIPDYNIHIQFNGDFTIRVMKLGREVNPGSLSNGENRIGNIMIMLALMKVFKLKNNVEFDTMFMDEVLDSGINGALLESVFIFIKNVAKQEKMKVFLISHREEIKDKVDEQIMVTKSRGISTISIHV